MLQYDGKIGNTVSNRFVVRNVTVNFVEPFFSNIKSPELVKINFLLGITWKTVPNRKFGIIFWVLH